MTTTTNLGITLIDTNQSQKEVTANAAVQALEDAITEWATVDVVDGTNTLASADVRDNQLIVLAEGSPGTTAAFTVELPALKRLLLIRNATTDSATIVCAGAATGAAEASIAPGDTEMVYCTGTEVIQVTSDASSMVSAFTDLSDVPASYSGQTGKIPAVNSGETGLDFKAFREFPMEINAQTGTSYALVLADAGKLVTLDNAAAITLTVPEESSVDFPVGTQILLAQLDTGQVTVTEGATAVTIVSPETTSLRKAGAQAALVKIGADTWLLEGNLELSP